MTHFPHICCRTLFFSVLSALSIVPLSAQQITLDDQEMAGISGLRTAWDLPIPLSADGAVEEGGPEEGRFGKSQIALWSAEKRGDRPGAAVFDAVHRSLLVRFPGAARKIAAELAAGKSVAKIELILPFKGIELWPEGYNVPPALSFLGDSWAKDKPRWHAEAWALRQPWKADAKTGPTYNASANGQAYWTKFGAQDTATDRFPNEFGPAEVSEQNPEGRLDVTPLLTDASFGASVGERLRVLEHNGFLVKKEELYDPRLWVGGYEWATARGPQGIFIKAPSLVVTFAPGPPMQIPADQFAAPAPPKVKGQPTAFLPSQEEFSKLAQQFAFARPKWMTTDWQWQRVEELNSLGGGEAFPATYEAYLKWIDEQLGRPPRSWYGFDAPNLTENYFKYKAALPAPLSDHWKLYWTSWLMPDRSYTGFDFGGKKYDFAHGYVGAEVFRKYMEETGDWRGNYSVYRTYVRDQGTMNFNHWSTAAVLLGGKIIDSPEMMAEGRRGLEKYVMRLWSWSDGSTQESIDHYYFGLSLKSQKVFADFGPTLQDRLIGETILAKSVEELASNFHPGLRRFIASSGRTGINYVLGTQEGAQHILHTLSPAGALTDVSQKTITAPNVQDLPVIGHDLPPGDVARQTLNGTWAPIWFSNIVDEKALPSSFTAEYRPGGPPHWRRSYLGKNYGLASIDISGNATSTVPMLGQWRRADKKVDSMLDLGTLLVRSGINRTELLDSVFHGTANQDANGSIGVQGHDLIALQDKNRVIVLGSPVAGLKKDESGRADVSDVTSLQTTIGLFNFASKPGWAIYLDGKPLGPLPVKTKFGTRITLQDGVSYVALIPIPASNLGRDTEVEISNSGEMTTMQGGGKVREALRIDAYTYKSNKPLDKARPDLDAAYGGYVIELGDHAEYGSFQAFQRHIADAKLVTKWDAGQAQVDVSYTAGKDVLHIVYAPAADENDLSKRLPVREVNGAWPYLPPGLERDSSFSQIGFNGRLEKNGAVLETEAERKTYLLTEPVSGHFVAYNPFSDLTFWKFTLPNGSIVTADGRLGMTRMTFNSKENTLDIAYVDPVENTTPGDPATAIVITGPALKVSVNDKPVTPQSAFLDSTRATVFPLTPAFDSNALKDRWETAQKALKRLSAKNEKK